MIHSKQIRSLLMPFLLGTILNTQYFKTAYILNKITFQKQILCILSITSHLFPHCGYSIR